MPASILLSTERAGQIKRIAEARGLGVVETLEHWIAAEIAAGTIADELPGIEVKAFTEAGGVAIRFSEGFGVGAVVPTYARAIAEALTRTANGDAPVVLVNMGALVWHFRRHSHNAVIISALDRTGSNSGKRSLSLGVARDLARMINKASEEVENGLLDAE